MASSQKNGCQALTGQPNKKDKTKQKATTKHAHQHYTGAGTVEAPNVINKIILPLNIAIYIIGS
jgi:hypothetical protein